MLLPRRGLTRHALLLALAVVAAGCEAGGPRRASDIQNTNAIGDDIAAVTMTQPSTARAHDPNQSGPIPRSYQTTTR